MRLQREPHDRAVSPVVGVILMVAVTVILAAVVGTFVFDLHDPSNSMAGEAGVSVEENPDGTATVSLVSSTADSVSVSNGYVERELDGVGDSTTLWYGDNAELTVLAEKDGDRGVVTSHSLSSSDYENAVYMESSTCDDPGYCGAKVVVNDIEFFTGRGINVLELDSNGEFVSYNAYDTHNRTRHGDVYTNWDGESSITADDINWEYRCSAYYNSDWDTDGNCANEALMDHLNSIPDGHYVLVIGDDQPGSKQEGGSDYEYLDEPPESTFADWGADFGGQPHIYYRDNWLMVVEKGDGVIFERHERRGDISGIGHVSGWFYR